MRNGEVRATLYEYDCGRTTDPAQLKRYDEYTDQSIKAAYALIDEAHKYREQLIKRMDELLNMDYHTKVMLTREHDRWTNKVTYHLTTDRVYEDGTARTLEHTNYPGKERHKAIKAYNDLMEKCPQFEYVKEIEKSKFER